MAMTAQFTARPSRLAGAARRSWRSVALAIGLAWLLALPSAGTAGTTAPVPGDAQALADYLRTPGALAVVLVSLPGCGFCERIMAQQIGPLAKDPAYADLRVFEISLSDRAALARSLPAIGPPADPPATEGHPSAAAFAGSLGVRVAPTVLLLGAGRELAERLVGYTSADFYWAYLQERIDQARKAR
ncbi:MAG: hypothetical protein R3E68_12505 [Burkholderiaceae bacterium]